jgi:hypothetical protein
MMNRMNTEFFAAAFIVGYTSPLILEKKSHD